MINLNRKPRKQIGTRNGLRIFTRLKSETKLKTTKGINPITEKQKKINQSWKVITDQRCIEENFICQWCGKPGKRDAGFNYLTGHHKIKRRYNIHTLKNCYVAHLLCHSEIEEKNIDVEVYPTKEVWEKRNEQGYKTNK